MVKSNILNEDFANIASRYDFLALKNKSVFVTGSTGLLGSQLVLFMDYLNQTKNFGINIYALCRSEEKAKKVFADSFLRIHCVFGDVLNLPSISDSIDYVVHGASITASKEFINHAVETIDVAVNGTLNLLRFANEKKVKSFVYLSSMEAFGVTDGKGQVREEDLGYIDISSPRSSYMESKRMCENLCACFASEYGLDVKSIRLAQVFGVGIDYNDTRVAAYFARSVIEGTDIVLKTEGKTKRPILYSSDAISAILTVLLKGVKGNVYTAANPETLMSIRETAEIIIERIACNAIRLTFDIKEVPPEYSPNLNLNLNLNVDKLVALGWKPDIGLLEAYERLIAGMKEIL
ncbi:MAG: NAD(P)-dependent oxidoreductase [Treponema sp.]|nr:NAD(P)-dependent oxidoreductase [Treponema sp.]